MSNQGIRAFAREVFVAKNELRRRGEAFTGPKGNTQFRKEVMCAIMEAHGVTLASAATHYNDAFKFIKSQNAELVSGLGRPEDKNNGGRKPKAATVATAAVIPVPAATVLANMMAAIQGPAPKAEEAPAEPVQTPAPQPTVVPRSPYWQAQLANAE